MTSWYPHKTSPPVKYSNYFPDYNKRCPSGTATVNFYPYFVQANKPGYLDFPWIVKKLKS